MSVLYYAGVRMATQGTSGRKRTRQGHGRERRRTPPRKVLRIMGRIKSHLVSLYGDGLQRVILYGSQARGDATKDSDVDVAIVISDDLDRRVVEQSLEDLLLDVLLEDCELVSIVAMPESLFNGPASPFILNVMDEGVTV